MGTKDTQPASVRNKVQPGHRHIHAPAPAIQLGLLPQPPVAPHPPPPPQAAIQNLQVLHNVANAVHTHQHGAQGGHQNEQQPGN